MDEPCLTVNDDGAVTILTLNRPERGNAIDLAMVQALHEAADQLHAGGTARCVLLRAGGRVFSGGGDLGAFESATAQGPAQASRYIGELAQTLHRALLRLLAYDAPLVTAVQGAAAGAGMSLVLASDFSFLAPRARLLPAYAQLGLSGDGGMTWLLPRLCGMRKAAEILVLNAPIAADEAAALGLVTAALPEEGEAFQQAVLARARQIADEPRTPAGSVRRMLRDRMGDGSAALTLNGELMMRPDWLGALAAGGAAAEAGRPPPSP